MRCTTRMLGSIYSSGKIETKTHVFDSTRLLKSDVLGRKAQMQITVNTTQSIPLFGLHHANGNGFEIERRRKE